MEKMTREKKTKMVTKKYGVFQGGYLSTVLTFAWYSSGPTVLTPEIPS